MIRIVLLLVGACLVGAPVWANGFGESRSWQFSTPYERANKAAVRDMIERKKAGAYNTTNNYDINYNIDGDYVNCSVSATATGNQGSIDQTAPVGSPSVGVDANISSDASGNTSDTQTDGYAAAWGPESYGSSSSAGGEQNNASQSNEAGNSSSEGQTNSNVSQSNDGSSQDSSVNDSGNTTSVGKTSGNGGKGRVALNSSQSNQDSVLRASVDSSTACAFNSKTGVGN